MYMLEQTSEFKHLASTNCIYFIEHW